ncbi:LysR family transcriptional regulator [Variovorax saccharolyticus]|uniref:LysR family transcriptional regulator n=1 Tax=Variovorax saccharolyticus TaxID=3053516 RepID=UPI002578228E|nr:LysR family transcriptional regulator [Variovorax sp. J22R187]MDM0020856.1 LysR family transcriptional regulator [Variovorax sp. J22R187]
MSGQSTASAEMQFFSLVVRSGSLAAAARELGVTAPVVSRRLGQLEARLGVTLLNRTTRRIGLTTEGELYLTSARRILADIDDVERELTRSTTKPTGLLRINATLGFGRNQIAPLVSRFCKAHPQVQAQLQLSVNAPPLTDDSFDVCIRFGEPPDARVVARLLAPNRRLLCASPSYLARRGTPKSPRELATHDCISIRHGEDAYGVWRLRSGRREEIVKVHGAMSTNDGDIAVNWALDGHGILLRADWDVAKHLRSGRLRQVMENYETPPADVYAVYPHRHQFAGRVRAFVEFAAAAFARSTRASA